MSKDEKTPGQLLDEMLYARCLTYEEMVSLMQTIKWHSNDGDFEKLKLSLIIEP